MASALCGSLRRLCTSWTRQQKEQLLRVTLGCGALTTWRVGRQEHVAATRHSGQDGQVGQGLITLLGMAGNVSLMNCLLLELSM